MSYNFWDIHALAGPECNSSPTNTGSGASSHIPPASHFLQKGRSNVATICLDQYLIHSQFRVALGDDAPDVTDLVAYYDNHVSGTSIPGFNVDCFAESDISGALDVIEDKGSLAVLTPRTNFMFDDPQQALLQSPTLFPPLDDSLESPPVVTPKLEESEGLCMGSSTSSLTLSPFAPMPLPPIFTHESGSKVMPIPIDTISASPFWMAHNKTHKDEHSDERSQLFDVHLDLLAQMPTPDIPNPFTRGSAAVEPLWPPSSFPAGASAPDPGQAHPFIFPQVGGQLKDIPLEVAESLAAELRATGANVSLSSPFLMQFFGQPTGQTKWHCYIRGCGKQLTRKGHMMDHVRMHLDERSFTCDHCSQTFLRKADCKRHAATHNPTKAFPCRTCPKSYARKDLLTRHTRICRSKSEEDSDRPVVRRKRRKAIQKSAIINSQSTCDTPVFVAPDTLFWPYGCYEGGGESQFWGCDEDNKENIDPLMFPDSPMFHQSEYGVDSGRCDSDSENGRKKARSRP